MDFTRAWAGLSAESAHCFTLVWETDHLRKLNKSLLAFLASAVRSSLVNPSSIYMGGLNCAA